MQLSVDLWDLFTVGVTLGTLLFAATWTLLHRMVFLPLDSIANDLTEVKDVFGPRIAVLETKMEQQQLINKELRDGN